MNLVNKNILTARLERLRGYLEILETVQTYDCSRFIEDPFIHGTAERNLHLAIECLLDIGNHIISDKGYQKPENDTDIFRIFHKNQIIPDQLYEKLECMAAFRNILIHDYMNLDRSRIYQIIQSKTSCLEELGHIFARMI